MPIVIGNTAGGPGVAYTLATTDSFIVAAGAVIFSTGDSAVTGSGSDQFCIIGGSITSVTNDGLHLGSGIETNMRVTIAATGNIDAGDDGISLYSGGGLVENHGTITAVFGIYVNGDSGGLHTVLNTGTIHASSNGVLMGDLNGQFHFANHGLIISDDRAVSGGHGADRVINRGAMFGTVDLRYGDDLYDGRGGTAEGPILGDKGNDTFLLGNGAEIVNGGEGFDTLDFSFGAGVRVFLTATQPNTGAAAGDVYLGIEQVIGSALGNDLLSGNGVSNVLRGMGGADRLFGGGGRDRLFGGTGIDILTGGGGNDSFQFRFLGECGDRIVDFSSVGGNDDVFRIDASNFGGGLVAGALAANQFRARADNLAQDGDDRFIFRTTDATLWFDANGNVAGGPVLVADLQAGAALTAADILLI